MANSNSQTEKLLVFSTEKYYELLQHGKNMWKVLDDCDYSKVREQTIKLQQLQAEAIKQDEILLPLLKAQLSEWQKNLHFQKRLNYVRSILELNELLSPKIKGAMAVTSAELDQLRSNRTALAGYNSHMVNTSGHRVTG